jgi:endonuclease-3
MQRIPQEYLQHAHHWLILHGRYVCKAQRPRCEACIISDLCTAPDRILPVTPPAEV